MRFSKSLVLGLLLACVLGQEARPATRPLALVWRGPGACVPTCGFAANRVARIAGFRTLSIHPGFRNEAAFSKAVLWVQPGGKSVVAAHAMGPELMQRVRQFVADGGGYVGFCAGMFLSTDRIGTSEHDGLGIVPGSTELYLPEDPPGLMLPITTRYGMVRMYYHGGPRLIVNEAELQANGGEVIARYKDGNVAGIRAEFGKGRVAVAGVHPEAGRLWKLLKGIIDRSSQRWFAVEMMRWAAKQ
jgi:glutamine amidotransferase-like uncharacterized protein